MNLEIVLPIVWAGILGIAVIMYILLDGFDLGVGILFPMTKDVHDRDVMMNTVAPVWDGNETWLVLGGACLYGAFPLAYSTLLPSFYIPIMFMLLALIFRGVAFEFRFKAHTSKYIWDIAFFLGSTIATFMQGIILGTFVQGYTQQYGTFISDAEHWFSPFSLMTGIALVVGYMLLGSTWLIAKTTGELQKKMYGCAKWSLFGIGFFILIVSIWTPFVDPMVIKRWFSVPNIFFLAPIPLVTVFTGFALFDALDRRKEKAPFILSICLFLLSYAGLGISVWPYIIPHEVTIWDAAAPVNSQIFFLVGTVILLPLLFFYTGYVYRVFAGKVTKDVGYHD